MTLRETFLKDPFFHSAWQDMERTRQEFLANSREEPAGEARTGSAVAIIVNCIQRIRERLVIQSQF